MGYFVCNFDSFGVQHIPNEIKKIIDGQNLISNIFRIQSYDSIMCGYFCNGLINFMIKGKTLNDEQCIYIKNGNILLEV